MELGIHSDGLPNIVDWMTSNVIVARTWLCKKALPFKPDERKYSFSFRLWLSATYQHILIFKKKFKIVGLLTSLLIYLSLCLLACLAAWCSDIMNLTPVMLVLAAPIPGFRRGSPEPGTSGLTSNAGISDSISAKWAAMFDWRFVYKAGRGNLCYSLPY